MKRQKNDVWESIEKKRERLKGIYIRANKKVNEQFGRKTNKDVNRNRKLFWEELSNAKGGKVVICSRIKDGSGRLARREAEAGRILKICII